MAKIDTEELIVTLAVAGGALYSIKTLCILGGYITDKVVGLFNNMKEVKSDIKDIKQQINEINTKINEQKQV